MRDTALPEACEISYRCGEFSIFERKCDMYHRLAIVAALLIAGLLSGCQSVPSGGLTYDRTQEFPAFFRNQHKLYQSNGHEFRGYDIGKRRYFR
jgi:hypothetical protein